MWPSSKQPSFGQELVEAMRLVLAHHRGEIELEQVLPKSRVIKTPPAGRRRTAQVVKPNARRSS
jgi:hypothetical protein